MKSSFSTNAFVLHDVKHAIERIAAAGFQGVELLADEPHLYPHSMSVQAVDEVRSCLEHNSIRAANINANTAVGYYGMGFWEPLFEPSLANPVKEKRNWRIDYTKRCIDLARSLGAEGISITSGRMVPGTHPERSLELFRDSLSRLLEYATKNSVRIGIEYEPGLLIECCDEVLGLLGDMNDDNLGVNLDIGHSYVIGEDVGRVIKNLSDRIFHIHIEDIKGRKHYHLIPGSGDMDFGVIRDALFGINYRGFVTVELYTYPDNPEDAAAQSLSYLGKEGFFPGNRERVCCR